jgi:hypothetical protein
MSRMTKREFKKIAKSFAPQVVWGDWDDFRRGSVTINMVVREDRLRGSICLRIAGTASAFLQSTKNLNSMAWSNDIKWSNAEELRRAFKQLSARLKKAKTVRLDY